MALANDQFTEADALRDILLWSKDRPTWQRDALRRLIANGALTVSDLSELTEQCKNQELPVDPLAEIHITARYSGAPTVALKSLRDVQNVNALAAGQTLTFIPKGLTIVYGDNGAGKSGYVRILKQACRARTSRGKSEAILRNIYEIAAGPQRAELEFHIGGQVQKAEWISGVKSEPLLSEISVFDSRTASVHVEETNDLAYTPFPMKLLEQLVQACKSIKKALDDEIAGIKSQTPQSISKPSVSPETEVGQLMAGLSENSETVSVERLAALRIDELSRLAELTADFSEDPATVAHRLRSRKTRLQAFHTKLNDLASAVSSEQQETLKALHDTLKTKSDAARAASHIFAQDHPLEGVGTTTWQALWAAARAYSVEQSYPARAFPVIEDGARCVLCQQELGESAAHRLRHFEDFVQDHTQQEQAAAERALSLLTGKLARQSLLLISAEN